MHGRSRGSNRQWLGLRCREPAWRYAVTATGFSMGTPMRLPYSVQLPS
jgi:hypothetical protein